MSKKEDFKKFVSHHPEFIDYVRNNDTTWQRLYELYDIYGEDDKVWEKYLTTSEKNINFKGILNTLKNINLDSLEENINSIQKAVGLVEEFTKDNGEEKKKITPKREIIEDIYNGE